MKKLFITTGIPVLALAMAPADMGRGYERKDGGDNVPDSMSELKEAINGFMGDFEEFKKVNDRRLGDIEKKGSADVLDEQQVERINAGLDKLEAMNQRLTTAESKAEELKKLEERYDMLETAINRTAGTRSEQKSSPFARAEDWSRAAMGAMTKGMPNLSEDEQKALSDIQTEYKALNVGTDTAGGYLAPSEYIREIIKGVTELSPVRSLVRVRNTSFKELEIPKRTGRSSATRVTETGTRSESTSPTYGVETIPAPEVYAILDITNQMLEDSAFNMAMELQEEASDQFAVLEGAEFVSGTGVGEMQGILTHADVGETNSGSAASIADSGGQANGLIDLKHSLSSQYAANARWLLNRTSIGAIRKLKDSNGQYIWMPGIANGAPNTIDGDPYVEVPDMPSIAANAYPVAYGDFMRAYTMADRIAMEMMRDPYTQATAGKVRYFFRRRSGGKVTLAEAIKKLKIAA